MNYALGIDTGGTYTDAVLIDHDSGLVFTSAKALTTRHDLAIGIAEAVRLILGVADDSIEGFSPNQITLVSVSTTLATNALAESQRASVALVLIGYDLKLLRQYGFDRQMATDDIVHVRGGHDIFGEEAASLDESAVRRAILERKDRVDAFAVSGYFSVRNPAHEIRVRALIHELTSLPVTCGHELTNQLNAVRRATTTALNAHLIAPLSELISALQSTLAENGIAAPLMVVKGDGSLVRAEWAAQRPIETVLSGPAASLIGAWHLAGRRDAWVVDVGGTTTDIGALQSGAPLLNEQGAHVAGWRTMIEAIDIHTVGLGGDSYVHLDGGRVASIGPRRVIPLCLLGSTYPSILEELERQNRSHTQKPSDESGEFFVLARHAARVSEALEVEILGHLADGPVSLMALAQRSRSRGLLRHALAKLETLGYVRRSAFTPTDALHVLGHFSRWDVEASRLGAALLAATSTGFSAEELCAQVVDSMSVRIATELVKKVLADQLGPGAWVEQDIADALVYHALSGDDVGDLRCRLVLRRPIVAIGAPVSAYMPEVALRLDTQVVIPPHADVANAVGAVTGSVIQRAQAIIAPMSDGEYLRVYLPTGARDHLTLEDAVTQTREIMFDHVHRLAAEAGGEQIETYVDQRDSWLPVKGVPTQKIYMGSELTFSAIGRPSPAR